MTYFDSLKNASEITDVFFQRPNKYMAALTLAQELLREDSYLPSKDRELVAAYTSYLNGCSYCYGSHREFAASLGADEVDLSIFDSESSAHKLQPILDYVKKLTKSPSSLSQEDKDKVIASGFTEEELKDAIAVCAAFNFFNRIVEGHGIKSNEATYKTSAEMISKHGYDRRYK
jgi:uncharacterized peroxidase-related enzyme